MLSLLYSISWEIYRKKKHYYVWFFFFFYKSTTILIHMLHAIVKHVPSWNMFQISAGQTTI